MRNPEQMIAILKEMADSPAGELIVHRHLGMSEEERVRVHQIELLSDAGLVYPRSDAMVRITNTGYDFLNAVENNVQKKQKFLNLLGSGTALLEAVNAIVGVISK